MILPSSPRHHGEHDAGDKYGQAQVSESRLRSDEHREGGASSVEAKPILLNRVCSHGPLYRSRSRPLFDQHLAMCRLSLFELKSGRRWCRSYIRSSPQTGYEALGNALRIFPIAGQFRREQVIF